MKNLNFLKVPFLQEKQKFSKFITDISMCQTVKKMKNKLSLYVTLMYTIFWGYMSSL